MVVMRERLVVLGQWSGVATQLLVSNPEAELAATSSSAPVNQSQRQCQTQRQNHQCLRRLTSETDLWTHWYDRAPHIP